MNNDAIKRRILALMRRPPGIWHISRQIDGSWHLEGFGEVYGDAVRELIVEGKLKLVDADEERYTLK